MAPSSKKAKAKPRRAVVVGGLRTPFVKAFTSFTKMDTIALGVAAVGGLIKKLELGHEQIDAVIWGGVIFSQGAPNVGREIVLDLKLSPAIEGSTVSRACASSLQAITNAVSAIERGDADVIIAGGSDSTSNAAIVLPPKVTHTLAPLAFGKARTPMDYLGALAQLMPISEILPRQPKVAERTTGLTMGESAEQMARRNEITREAQDELAARSHHRAAAAIASGRFDDEVTEVETPDGGSVHTDGIVRGDTTVEKLSRLRPVFSKDGTITAGNASPLTDGAAAVVVMEEQKARALGYAPLAAFRSWCYVGVDPADQLLIGPAIAIPRALEKAGMKLVDVDLVDLHEAFAAQVLCVTKMLGSDAWARSRLGRDKAVGEIDPERLNVRGGSVAIGHPFGATGARMVNTMANELVTADKAAAVIGICAAGGLAGAAVMERVA
jgi:acetyl-CoA acyltransferase